MTLKCLCGALSAVLFFCTCIFFMFSTDETVFKLHSQCHVKDFLLLFLLLGSLQPNQCNEKNIFFGGGGEIHHSL